ncbi:hypothetical protein TDB9533_00664 [Thalassocella blandensis]|nr:hypothetical protein TDB9533_00664 [Thalassocella blandensis]
MFRKDTKNTPAKDNDQHKLEIIEEALLDSVSGGSGLDLSGIDLSEIDLPIIEPPICVGSQFCMIRAFE